MNLIEKIPATHFKPIQFRNEPLWKHFDMLNGFINKNFEPEFQDILAKPFLSPGYFNWHYSQSGIFKPLDTFSLSQKQSLLLSFHKFLNIVKLKISSLLEEESTDNKIWAEMLAVAFNEKNNIIYSNGKKIVLLWGFEYNNVEENYLAPSVFTNQSDDSPFESADHNTENGTAIDEPILNSFSMNEDNIDDATFSNTIFHKKIIVRSNKKQNRSNSFLYKYWWTIILLVLLLLLLFKNGCNLPFARSNNITLQNILPKDPLKRLPLDSSNLIKGDSGVSLIVADIFNIALKDKSKDFNVFALELKKTFPDSNYKIVYFDTTTSRLQFQFSDSDRTGLKQKIRDEMDDYDLLIWDESIFTNYKTFNDPIFSDASRSWYLNAVGATFAWEITNGAPNVTVAVIDDGFDLQNRDLADKIIKPYNVRSRNTKITADNKRFHGTHVAGIAIGSSNNGVGVCGIAPGCSFMPIQITNGDEPFTSSDVIDGILYAIRNDADVINLSLGKYFPSEIANLSDVEQNNLIHNIGIDEQEFWNELFTYAENENTIIVMASGNQHVKTGLDPMQRSEKAIKVSAVNSQLKPSVFSNFGELVTFYAPGEKIFGIIPGNAETFLDGTSMASPIVAGTVALMKSKNKNLNTTQVINILKKTSDQVRDLKPTSYFIRTDKALQSMK